MRKVLIVGNPNVGKSTLFNSLTKSSVRTGNFHGVTVEETSKIVTVENEQYEIVDLPGLYSLNTFSREEEVSKNQILKHADVVLFLVDANTLKRNLFLALQLKQEGVSFKILINNYDYFLKKGNKIDANKLEKSLGVEIEIINAKKIKASKKLFEIQKNGVKNENFQKKSENLEKNIKDNYNYLTKILDDCVTLKQGYVYGQSKLDKFLLNPFIMTIGFALMFFLSLYMIFFLLGPAISVLLSSGFENFIINPFCNFLCSVTDNIWIIEFFRQGVFSSFVTILCFLPQICLMFTFLTILEDSGIISRMAYVFDDFLSKFGLNGKAVYILLLGLGCNTMSSVATRSLNGKNLRTKTAIINPYISCMARLPVYVLVASALFSKMAYLIVAALYLLGFIIAMIVAIVLNKFMPTKSGELLLEFPPTKGIDFKHVLSSAKTNAVDFIKRVFSVVLCVGVIVWILTHTKFNLHYTQTINESILFIVADKLKFLFAPIGLNNSGIVSSLFVGIMAKELIISTFSVCNNVTTTQALTLSLISPNSVINFNIATGLSFLIFSLLYAPCVSNLAVIKKETDNFTMWFCLISQFVVAYLLSFIVYQLMTKGVVFTLVILVIISIIILSGCVVIKKVKQNRCLTCGRCKK